mgnify:FL=1
MFTEQKLSPDVQENEPNIIIKKSTDAPLEIKKNPFYDPEIWGRANSEDDIYLPDSDEPISFAIAAHEIGHLIKDGKGNDMGLDNFEATRAEEQRAWDKGWEYLQKYLGDYYLDNPKMILQIQEAFEKIKILLKQATDLSEDMYLEFGSLGTIDPNEIKTIQKERRKAFSSEKGGAIKQLFEDVKKEKIGIKSDWDKFVTIIKKAVKDILIDNNKIK